MINFLRKMVGKAPLTEQQKDFNKWLRNANDSPKESLRKLWEHNKKYFPDQVPGEMPKWIDELPASWACGLSKSWKFKEENSDQIIQQPPILWNHDQNEQIGVAIQLELNENSILVLSTEHSMTIETAERLKESMKKIVDGEFGHKIVVLSDGLKLSVIHRDWMNNSEKRAMRVEDKKLGAWMSAALDDPMSCQSFKDDINTWLETFHYPNSAVD